MAVKNTTEPDFKESDADDAGAEDIELDDGPGFDDEPEEDAAESEEESDDSEDDDTDDFDEDESESEEVDGKADEADEAEPDDKPDAPELSDEEQRKARNKQQAEARIQAKQEREATIKQQQDEYLADADPDDPRDLAVRQLQIDAYNNKVEANTNKLTNGYERAVKDFPILSDPAPEVQAFVNDAIDAFQAMNVTIDKFGNPTTVGGDLYAYLQAKADSIAALTGRGVRKQTQDKTKQRAKALTAPSRPPREPKKDADLDAFDEEAARY